MNFLAHIFLSDEDPDITAGNFMADSVKGSAMTHFSTGIQKGIQIHRAIDTYTDTHSEVGKSKERLRVRFGKYAPVVADVYYDHFLAKEWEKYSDMTLRDYVDSAYDLLKTYYAIYPERTQRFYTYMLKYDILFAYSTIEGIDRVMNGMARRASFHSGMEASAEELVKNYDAYKKEFTEFFPQLQQHIRTFTL